MLRPVKATVYLATNSLLYRLTVPQLVKKLLEFFKTRMFITAYILLTVAATKLNKYQILYVQFLNS
jgi:hypothetical protein